MRVGDFGEIQLIGSMGTDASIDASARVSFEGGDVSPRTEEEQARLINYLMKNRHTSPFEMVETQWRVKAPLFVARQWVRHRTASWNEISGRYVKLPDEYFLPHWKGKPTGGAKQGAGEILPYADRVVLNNKYREVIDKVIEFQKVADGLGVANEQSRAASPLSQYTVWIWKIDLHNLLHFLALRLDPHAQGEIREYANAIASEVAERWPLTWRAFREHRLEAE